MPSEPEFEQAYNEIATTLKDSTLFEKHPEYKKALKVVSIPERIIQFRVTWEDDEGNLQVNNGYRVQFNSALGPYKGGLRFHPTVNLSILKFLGFEQIFKNALTGTNIGGGKGGADFNPKGRSVAEIRRFCCAFMGELQRHIGADTDVPAGDIAVGGREIGFLFGAYKKAKNVWEGTLTGKGLAWGGSLIRPEATGFGLLYYVENMVKYATKGEESIAGKLCAISGSGNVAQYAAFKVLELGGKVLSLSDSKGALVTENGLNYEQVKAIQDVKADRGTIEQLISENKLFSDPDIKYYPGERPWTYVKKVDIVLPCATQNEISADEAKAVIAAGAKYVAEGSNMGSTQEAIDVFEAERLSAKDLKLWYAPGKAANAGGVAISAIEMSQNSQRLSYTAEKVDSILKDIMTDCFNNCVTTAIEYSSEKNADALPSLVKGANIAGFVKVIQAMYEQGDLY
ncbi:glutamate dehydrogenase [Ascoidea rubescens DSM 1968]|uniref:Glutamate dehydrogenase n=1 Tax=Ascoidea rubescens DSM 1968 TaxID=1344418 RepID=A0A1D2VHE5_9ASCO|nr:NADP(+)-dependent glutamate dehydrogenase [Ascoidea rubescens DSM 1968]ODV61056.1 NADP(+)-dependent glutamate dehydrogenase [Ascoidea rubescens DSM 1968]